MSVEVANQPYFSNITKLLTKVIQVGKKLTIKRGLSHYFQRKLPVPSQEYCIVFLSVPLKTSVWFCQFDCTSPFLTWSSVIMLYFFKIIWHFVVTYTHKIGFQSQSVFTAMLWQCLLIFNMSCFHLFKSRPFKCMVTLYAY